MIEIGSFIGLAAITKSEITIKNVAYDKLGMIPSVFTKAWALKWSDKKMIFTFHLKRVTKYNHLLTALFLTSL